MKNAVITRPAQGFSLVEVTLAIGVAAFCLLALFGLLPIGVSSNQASLEQTAAAGLAASVVADLRAVPILTTPIAAPAPSPAVSKQYAIPVVPKATGKTDPVTGSPLYLYTLFLREDGSLAQVSSAIPADSGWKANLAQNPRYRVTLAFNPPATGQLTTVPVRVLVTWPAVSDPGMATSLTAADGFPSKFSGSFEVVTALDRY